MRWTAGVDGDLQTTLEKRGLSVRYVVDSAAQRLILAEDIEDALEGWTRSDLLAAANDNSSWPGRRLLLAV
jgi:hypothetical protein